MARHRTAITVAVAALVAVAPSTACTTKASPHASSVTSHSSTSTGADPTTTASPAPPPSNTASPATPAPTTAGPAAALGALIDQLEVATPHEGGYERTLFHVWIDADLNHCDTRCEVLRRQRRTDLPGLPAGGWFSAYDGYSSDDATEFQIDHVVPLGEAWMSGAWAWDAARREAFANDLADPELLAVTAATNGSKSDKDPARWQPPRRDDWCAYVSDWVSVKLHWGLIADPAEVAALHNMARGCAPGPVPTTAAAPATTAAPPRSPSTSTPAPGVGFANCAAARAAGAAPLHKGDPGYSPKLDRDGDGIACE